MNYAEAKAKRQAAAIRKAKRQAKAGQIWADKPKKVKRKKSLSISKLKKLLWEQISIFVRSWSAICIVPGCGEPTQCAAHIVPSNDGAATRFFLLNLYPCCHRHNDAERHRRAVWVYKHREMFGGDVVDALYAYAATEFPIKRWWLLEQTERMVRLNLARTEALLTQAEAAREGMDGRQDASA